MDYDILRQSAKFTFLDGSPVNTRTWILRILKNLINPEAIEGIFKVDIGGTWYATFSDANVADKVIGSDFTSLDTKVTVSRADKSTVLLKVLWLPLWIKRNTVISFLEQFGKVVSCAHEKETSEGVKFCNGNIKVTLEISEQDIKSLPYRTKVAGKDFTYRCW